jgi:hypothetical protein
MKPGLAPRTPSGDPCLTRIGCDTRCRRTPGWATATRFRPCRAQSARWSCLVQLVNPPRASVSVAAGGKARNGDRDTGRHRVQPGRRSSQECSRPPDTGFSARRGTVSPGFRRCFSDWTPKRALRRAVCLRFLPDRFAERVYRSAGRANIGPLPDPADVSALPIKSPSRRSAHARAGGSSEFVAE